MGTINENELLYQQKYNHQLQSIDRLHILNVFLMFVYYFCILVVFYHLYKKTDINMYEKIGICILLLIYPFIAFYIETYVYQSGNYAWSFINGEPYTDLNN